MHVILTELRETERLYSSHGPANLPGLVSHFMHANLNSKFGDQIAHGSGNSYKILRVTYTLALVKEVVQNIEAILSRK